MLRATRRLAPRVAVAAVAFVAAGCADDILPGERCPSPLAAVPVREEPSDLYHDSAVACTGDLEEVCDARTARWETRVELECGLTRVGLCEVSFAGGYCLDVYLDHDATLALAQLSDSSDVGGRGPVWYPEDGWVAIAAWTEFELRGVVALDLGDGWITGTFDWSEGEDGVPDGTTF